MTDLDHPVLHGRLVRLEPLAPCHAAGLAAAAEESRDSYDWTWVPTAATVDAYVAEQIARTGLAPYAQLCRRSGRVVGATAYWDPRGEPLAAIDVGFTWLAASAQRSGMPRLPGTSAVRNAVGELGGAPGGRHGGHPPGPGVQLEQVLSMVWSAVFSADWRVSE
jgi:hypothetical protein